MQTLIFVSLPAPRTPTCHWETNGVPASLRLAACFSLVTGVVAGDQANAKGPLLEPPCVGLQPGSPRRLQQLRRRRWHNP